jgi:hypothetical protein
MEGIVDQIKMRNIRTNESQKINEKKIQRLDYLEREKLDDLKKKLNLRVFRDLSNKYNILLKEKKYCINNFKKDFDIIMEKNYDFNNPNYMAFFRLTEKSFLNKMFHIEDKNIYNDPDFLNKNFQKKERINFKSNGFVAHKNNFFNYKRGNSLVDVDKYHSEINKREKEFNDSKRFYSPLRDELERKQTYDDWGKLSLFESKKYLEEKEKLKKIELKNKNDYKEFLFKQMKEKKNCKKWDEEEEKFYKTNRI